MGIPQVPLPKALPEEIKPPPTPVRKLPEKKKKGRPPKSPQEKVTKSQEKATKSQEKAIKSQEKATISQEKATKSQEKATNSQEKATKCPSQSPKCKTTQKNKVDLEKLKVAEQPATGRKRKAVVLEDFTPPPPPPRVGGKGSKKKPVQARKAILVKHGRQSSGGIVQTSAGDGMRCHVCNYSCEQRYKLMAHFEKDHIRRSKDNLDYQCAHCDYLTPLKVVLKSHIITQHANE